MHTQANPTAMPLAKSALISFKTIPKYEAALHTEMVFSQVTWKTTQYILVFCYSMKIIDKDSYKIVL